MHNDEVAKNTMFHLQPYSGIFGSALNRGFFLC